MGGELQRGLGRGHPLQLDALAALLSVNRDPAMRRPTAVPENREVVLQDVDDRPELVDGGHALPGAAHPERGDLGRGHLLPMLLSRAVVGVNPYAALLAKPFDDLGIRNAFSSPDLSYAFRVESDCRERVGDGGAERLVYENERVVRQRSSPATRLPLPLRRATRRNWR